MISSSRHNLYWCLPDGNFVRLLTILPGKDDQPGFHDASDTPSYEAISYLWGDPIITYQIIYNDQFVDVTSNLIKRYDCFDIMSGTGSSYGLQPHGHDLRAEY